MREVWVAADAVVSPLGSTSAENFSCLLKEQSGLSTLDDPAVSAMPVIGGKIASLQKSASFSRFEAMCIEAIESIAKKISIPRSKTIFVLSSTKGNISVLTSGKSDERIHLHEVSGFLANYAGLEKNIVISNACISGVMALTVAKRFLQDGKFDHALVVGADELSSFVVSGFQSLKALSDERCKPFDAGRKGINLGEAAAAMLLTSNPEALGINPAVSILGTGLTNDANHISGPSRTGQELASAIAGALNESSLSPADIDFISAHGTATLYNDEMEAKAFNLAGLQDTPLNSLKAFYGHTLGAAGLVETVMSMHSLLANTLIASLGFEKNGVSMPVNIIRKAVSKPLKTFLKTASGFGGCNAALVLQKIN